MFFSWYRIVGDFHGKKKKLLWIGEIKEKNFCGLLADATKRCHARNFTEKSFVNSHKAAKSAKVFFLERFPAIWYVSYLALIGLFTNGLELGIKEPLHWLIREWSRTSKHWSKDTLKPQQENLFNVDLTEVCLITYIPLQPQNQWPDCHWSQSPSQSTAT